MKDSIKLFSANMRYMMSNQRFKFILYTLIGIGLCDAKFETINFSYVNSVLGAFVDSNFVIISMSLYLVNTINTLDLFDRNHFYIIRFKNRKEYLSKLIKNIIASNLIVFGMQLITLIICILTLNRNGIIIDLIGNYNITNIVYLIFYLIRFIFIVQIFSIVSALIMKLGGRFIMLGLNIFFVIMIIVAPYEGNYVVDSLSKMYFNPAYYLRIVEYSSFNLELIFSAMYIIGLVLGTYTLYRISERFIKQVGK